MHLLLLTIAVGLLQVALAKNIAYSQLYKHGSPPTQPIAEELFGQTLRFHPERLMYEEPRSSAKESTPGHQSHHNNCTISTIEGGMIKADCSFLGITDIRSLRLDRPEIIGVLNLTGNLIESIPEGVWTPFKKLQCLSLSENLLSRLESNSFNNLTGLRKLRLDGNGLTMTRQNFPKSVFDSLPKLTDLYINNNTKLNYSGFYYPHASDNQTYPDWALSSLTSLESLYIDGLPDQKFGIGFKNMTSLRYISMNSFEGQCVLGHLRNDTFQNVAQLQSLTMKRCGIHITRIELDVLKPLQNLKHLDVSRNVDINLDGLVSLLHGVVNSTKLWNLNVNMVVNPYSVSRCVSNQLAASLPRSLEYLDAASNNMEMVSDKVFELLPRKLSYLNLNGNRFFFGRYLQNISLMSNVKTLKMNGWIPGYDLPTYFAAVDQQPILKCNYSKPGEKEKIHLKLPPNLERLEINLAELSLRITEVSVDPNNSLREVYMSGNNFPSLIGPVTGLEKLETLDLGRNNIKYISPKFFNNSPLINLYLNANSCGSYLYDPNEDLKFPDTLRHLDFSNTTTYDVKIDFGRLKHLETLKLEGCSLQQLTSNLSQAKGLRHLDLSGNPLHRLNPGVTKAISNIPNLTVDFSNNIIGCSCQNLDFIKWLVHYPHLTNKNLTRMWCDHGGIITEIKDFRIEFELLERQCASNLLLLSICTSVSVSALLLIFALIACRFRWKLRFWYYSAYLYMSSDGHSGVFRAFQYDVNVAYCKDDEDFAEETLNNALTGQRLNLRISGRDSSVGVSIFRDIVETVQICRKTLVVVSPEMLSCKWCQATINLAAQEALSSGRPVLLFLVVRPVQYARMATDLLFHIQNSEVSFYPPEESRADGRSMALFWRKLARDLR